MEIEKVAQGSEATAKLEGSETENPRDSTGTQHEIPDQASSTRPHGLRFAAIMAAALSSVFLSSLDENIIGTATSQITNTFNSLHDVGWYGSAYFLTLSSLMMGYNQLYEFFDIKYVYLSAIAFFEAGSLICGLAPNSYTFIIGRAVTGAGSAGINAGFMTTVTRAVPLQERPVYLSSYGAIFGVATVVAPVLGGALTTHVTWRACFLINIPFGVLSAVIVLLCFSDLRPDATHAHQTLLGKLKHLDFAGTVLILGHATCLLMALQISSTSQTWSDPQVIGLLVASLVLLCLFLLVQAYQKEIAILQLRVLRNRSIAGGALFLGTVGAAMNVFEYYLPIWFQAVQGVSAFDLGVRILPTVAGWALFSFVGSYGVTKTGYYAPFMLACSVLLSIGSGLITTWTKRRIILQRFSILLSK